ncbi:MAG: asparagine synthase (glutamine-hydrolyzing) [Deltaproteobacteria bacterium]|nr:MAG: asparagine synthase (glutamine-hydrolyzing) [Deltaproteobacteria bacterium]
MCGITGIVDYNKLGEEDKNLLPRMLGIMRYRGPDAFGMYVDDCAALGSTRLSIIDLNTGDQPIHNENKSVWVVLNGEIFNYPELREELKAKGHSFYTKSDTEVLVHLYEEYGTGLFDHLNGQFGIAIWDTRKKTLVLGRDRVGIRPLFYHLSSRRLVFGSEIKSIFVDSSVPRRLNLQALSDVFTCWAPLADETLFQGVSQVPPGSFAVFSSKGFKVKKYWSLNFGEPEPFDNRPLSHWTGQLTELLLDATRIRLRADVPVGAYLSGGLDSTFISTLVKRNFNNTLCTFSVNFTDSRFDETPYQEKAIASLKTLHKRIKCSESDIGNVFDRIIWHTEVPLLRTAPAPLFYLSRLVRENNFKVVLTGEGADELFAGYNIFREVLVRGFWARYPESSLRPMLLERLYPYVFSQGNGRAKKFLTGFFKKSLTRTDSPAYSHLLRWENTSQLRSFFSKDIQSSTGGLQEFTERFITTLPESFMDWHPLSRAQYTEITIFLSNYLLSSQGDRMAMGNSVEGRFPYLDHRVIEFATTIPVRYRINGLNEKFLLKKAASNLIPREVAERPKQPYRAPISKCFLGQGAPEFARELLSERCIKDKGYFDPVRVSRLMAKCRNQDGNLVSERENMALVGILSTQLLDELFIKNFPPYPIKEPENVRIFG